ncbi:MAG: DUF262 domain-containing protein [Mesorhizobium sp.]|nr:MAG: DUF262 domain-containing protein [Mesorhizobium sp.]
MQLSPSDPDIQTIVARIRNGDLDLQPDFQRGEVWSTHKKRRLIDSILRNWYVPPIHTVVVPGSHQQEVLDGQQRLVAIRDFVNGHYSVDGNIPPFDERMQRLDGLRYEQLPNDVRRLFDNFTIRVMRVTDYQPEICVMFACRTIEPSMKRSTICPMPSSPNVSSHKMPEPVLPV